MDHKKYTEKEFLGQYDVDRYQRPSVSVDVALFSVESKGSDNYRKLPETNLRLLMIKRGKHPFMGQWALPGGFLTPQESIEEAARRKMLEETGVDEIFLHQIGMYSKADRDPRTWVISAGFVSLVESSRVRAEARAGVGADEAAWFDVSMVEIDAKIIADIKDVKTSSNVIESDAGSIDKKARITNSCPETCMRYFELKLTNGGTTLRAILKETKVSAVWGISKSLEIIRNDGIAFDHAEIIADGIFHIRSTAFLDETIFSLVPEKFTLTQLQNIYECVLDRALLKADFRRRMKSLVEETDDFAESKGHRPSKLYIRSRTANQI